MVYVEFSVSSCVVSVIDIVCVSVDRGDLISSLFNPLNRRTDFLVLAPFNLPLPGGSSAASGRGSSSERAVAAVAASAAGTPGVFYD